MKRLRWLGSARPSWVAPIAGALLACSSQVDPDYSGEPIATLHGVVSSSSALESDVSAAIVWGSLAPEIIGEHIAVEGDFPATFTLNLYAPPPPEAEVKTVGDYCINGERTSTIDAEDPCEGQRVPSGTGLGLWSGYLTALDANVPDGEVSRDDIRGIDVGHRIVYYDHDTDSLDSAMPSARELAQRLQLVSVEEEASYEIGYKLLKVNPELRALEDEANDCQWVELCVHWTTEVEVQDRADWAFERCQQRFPENPTCSAFVEQRAEGEPASSTECREQYESSADRDCRWSHSLPHYAENPDGLDDPITIQLGLGYFDANE